MGAPFDTPPSAATQGEVDTAACKTRGTRPLPGPGFSTTPYRRSSPFRGKPTSRGEWFFFSPLSANPSSPVGGLSLPVGTGPRACPDEGQPRGVVPTSLGLSLLHRSGLILKGGVIPRKGVHPYGRKIHRVRVKRKPRLSHRGFPVSFRSRYFFFFFFLNDLWHAPHCLPMRPTAFLMAAGPPL